MPILAELERLCFSEPWSEDGLRAELGNETARFLTAEQNGQVAGYAGMHAVCGEGYIANIAVFPAYRGRGVGRALLQGLIAMARRSNVCSSPWRCGRETARRFPCTNRKGFAPWACARGFTRIPKRMGLS